MKKISCNFLDLTVAIPCYNAEKTINRLFNSIAKQRYPDRYLQILVVNDGSTDNTPNMLAEWQKKFGENIFTIINQQNQGLAETRNVLLANIKTKWFIFIDSDDYFAENAFINFCHSSRNESADLIIGKTLRKKGNKLTSWWLTNFLSINVKRYIASNLFFAWNKVYNTAFIKSCNPHWKKGCDMLEDQYFFSAIAPKMKNIGVCKHFTYYFVFSKNSMSAVTNFKKVNDRFEQICGNLDLSIKTVLGENTPQQLSKIEKRILSSIIYNYLMQIFLTFILYPAYYNFPKEEQDSLRYDFYNNKRQIVIDILNKYNVKFSTPYGWWRKITYFVLRLKSRYNVNKFKMYVDKDKEANKSI